MCVELLVDEINNHEGIFLCVLILVNMMQWCGVLSGEWWKDDDALVW